MHRRWELSSVIKQLLETLFYDIKMYTDFTADVLCHKKLFDG